jgi:WD40 repeat protein
MRQGSLSSSGGSERSFVGRTLSSGGSGSSGGSHGGARAPLQTLAICDRGLNAAALSPDGSRLATCARDGVVRVHDLASGMLLTGYRVSPPLPCHPVICASPLMPYRLHLFAL